jgi:hypothetical protein
MDDKAQIAGQECDVVMRLRTGDGSRKCDVEVGGKLGGQCDVPLSYVGDGERLGEAKD